MAITSGLTGNAQSFDANDTDETLFQSGNPNDGGDGYCSSMKIFAIGGDVTVKVRPVLGQNGTVTIADGSNEEFVNVDGIASVIGQTPDGATVTWYARVGKSVPK